MLKDLRGGFVQRERLIGCYREMVFIETELCNLIDSLLSKY